MNKLTGFERFCINSALDMWIKEQEQHIVKAEAAGKRTIIAQGYWKMVGEDLERKITKLTYKKHLEDVR
jgi:hypothetical protein